MFRKMRRFKQQLTEEACRKILEEEPRGVLAVLGDEEYPYTVPLDFIYDPEENCLYFHGAKEGHKVDALKRHEKASFCVMNQGYRKEGEWALNISSVVVFGRLRIVEEKEKTIQIVRRIGLKYNPDPEDVEREIRMAQDRVLCLCLKIEHMTGKLVNES